MTNTKMMNRIKDAIATSLLAVAMWMLPADSLMVDALRWAFLMRNDRESYEAMCELYRMRVQPFDQWADLWAKISAKSPIRDLGRL